MKISLSPVRGLPGQPETEISVSGDTVTVDGTPYDLSAVPEGGEALPRGHDHPFNGPITRQDGVIHCTLRVLLDDSAEADQPADPAHWTVTVADGAVTIPATRDTEDT
jgi:hypothetical protein